MATRRAKKTAEGADETKAEAPLVYLERTGGYVSHPGILETIDPKGNARNTQDARQGEVCAFAQRTAVSLGERGWKPASEPVRAEAAEETTTDEGQADA